MELLLGFVAGAFVGWHLPQPAWAKAISDKFKEWLVSKVSK